MLESLIGRGRIDGYIRHASEHRNIENALVRLAVLADKSGAVDGYDHLLLLERGIVQKLIEAALEESGIDGENRDKSALCKTERERHGVLLGDADIKKSVFMFARKSVESRADGHRGGYGADAVIAGREAAHDIAEIARKARAG